MRDRYIIGRGELLTYDIPGSAAPSDKKHPYTLPQAKRVLVPQLEAIASKVRALPAAACPFDVAVFGIELHPTYISKSFSPQRFLLEAGLVQVGSRTTRSIPRIELRKRAPKESDTTELFVAATRSTIYRLPSFAESLEEDTDAGDQFREIENFKSFDPVDRIRSGEKVTHQVYEVGIHLSVGQPIDEIQRAFAAYAKSCNFHVNSEFDFPFGGMLFVAVEGPSDKLQELAQFALVRVIRPMPRLRAARPVMRSNPIPVGFQLPTAQPLSDEPSVAILDGGLPNDHVLGRYVKRYEKSDPIAADVDEYLEHGLAVTSAFLFGPITPDSRAPRPYAAIDHYRVLDATSDTEDPYELYRTLAHVEEVLLSRQYRFINLSLGPDLPIEDSDVHAWTALLDTMLSDGETLLTVAVGNNGERDHDLGLNRIQVPSDSVNALAIGAANSTNEFWARAAYSAVGPGRSPGRRKPDVVAFGGSPVEYFHVVRPGGKPDLAATMGTSFASPYGLRTAVGIRAILGEDIHPLTIKTLLIHGATYNGANRHDEIGWGRINEDVNELILCPRGTARIIYQGLLRPGKYLRAPIPLPSAILEGKARITATFCYASPVDVEDSASYTKAGLRVTFRPHSERKSGKKPDSNSFFSTKEIRNEQELRADLGKWETVLHHSEEFYGDELKEPSFDIHYNARENGANARKHAELIKYALVISIHASKHDDLHTQILQTHAKLKEIEPKISIPLSSR